MSGSQGFGGQSFGQGYGQFRPQQMPAWGGQYQQPQQPQYTWNPTAQDMSRTQPAPEMSGIPGGPGSGSPVPFNEGYNPNARTGRAAYGMPGWQGGDNGVY